MFVRVEALVWAAVCITLQSGCGAREVEPSATARHAVLVSLDALAARHVGAYGHARDTTPESSSSTSVFRHKPPAELYDLRADPEQTRDLAAEQPELAAALERRMLDWYAESEARRAGFGPVEREKILSDEERERLRALGYGE